MKLFTEIKEQYEYLWWWLLNQGIVVSALIVNTFLLAIFTIVMVGLVFFLKWIGRQ